MANYDEFHEELKGTLQSEFEKQNPKYWNDLQGRPRDIERARAIAGHTDDAEKVLDRNYEDERQDRISNHAIKVWHERSAMLGEVAEPVGQYIMTDQSILEEARKRADTEHQNDIAVVRRAENGAIQDVADGRHLEGKSSNQEEIKVMTEVEKKTHFKAEIHSAVDNSKQARIQAHKLFNNHETRDELIEKARENGSEHPEQDVQKLYHLALNDVDKQLHKDIHATFEKYGFDYDKKEVEFYTNPEPDEQENNGQNYEIGPDIAPNNDPEIDDDQTQ